MKAKQYILNNQRFTEEIKGIKAIPGNQKKRKHNDPYSMGCSKAVLRGKFLGIQTYLRKQKKKSQINNETKKTSNQQPNLVPKGIRKRIIILSQIRRKKS